MLDAYTVRKAVPRILIAVIGINLSIYFCVALVDMTNIIGRGMSQLIVEPFITNSAYVKEAIESNAENNTVAGLAGAGLGGLIAAAFAIPGVAAGTGLGLIGFLFPLIITISLIILAVIFTIIIRQALLLFLIIISPVAIACFVLPGTEKYFQRWLDLFMKTLLVYPIIAVIFAVSTAMGSVLIGTSDVSGDGIALAKIIGAVLVIYAPLVLIPFAFKFAGGALSAVMNAASGQATTAGGRASKRFGDWRRDPNSWAGKNAAAAKDQRIERGFTGGQIMSGVSGGIRSTRRRNRLQGESRTDALRRGYSTSAGAIGTEDSMHRLDEIGKHSAVRPVANNDDFLKAWMLYDNDQERISFLQTQAGGGYDADTAAKAAASIRRADAVTNREQARRFIAVNLPKTGTAFNVGDSFGEGAFGMNRAIIEAAGGDAVLEGNMMAMARSGAQEARRFDLVAGFGTNMRAISAQRGGATAEEVNRMVTDNVLETQGPGAIIGGRGDSVRLLVPAMQRRIDNSVQAIKDAATSGDAAGVQEAQRLFKQELASTAGLLDVAGQVSPENQKILANELMSRVITDVNGKQASIGQSIDLFRTDSDFQEMRREYAERQRAQYSAAQAAAQAGGPPATPPTNPPMGPI